jgi:hypothetical protein
MDEQGANREGGRGVSVSRLYYCAVGGIEVLVPLAIALFLVYHGILLRALPIFALSALMAFKLWSDLQIEKERKK